MYLKDATPANAVEFTVFSADSHNAIDNKPTSHNVLESEVPREQIGNEGFDSMMTSSVKSEESLTPGRRRRLIDQIGKEKYEVNVDKDL